MTLDALISEDYRAQQQALHLMPEGYGGKGSRWARTVLSIATQVGCASVLDYGCGRGSLARTLSSQALACREYDPAIPGKDGRPAFADLVVCTDVLEHVEPDKLHNVLHHIDSLSRMAIILVVCLRPSHKVLPDGRNAHLLVKPAAWWDAQTEQQGWERLPLDLQIPVKVDQDKHWIALLRPHR